MTATHQSRYYHGATMPRHLSPSVPTAVTASTATRGLLGGLVGLLLATTAIANPIATLPQAISTGLGIASEIAGAEAQARAASEEVAAIQQVGQPTLDFFVRGGVERSAGNRSFPSRQSATLGRLEAGPAVRLLLWDGGASAATAAAQSAQALSAEQTTLLVRDTVLYRIVTAYLALLRERELTLIAERAVGNHQRFSALARSRVQRQETGEGPALAADARLATREREYAEALQRLRDADARFRRAIGEPADQMELPTFPDPGRYVLTDALALAESRSVAIARATASLDAARAIGRAADLASNPRVTLDGEASAGRAVDGVKDQTASGSLIATVAIPLYDGGGRDARRRAAAAQIQAAEAALQTARRDQEEAVRVAIGLITHSRDIEAAAVREVRAKERLLRAYSIEVETTGRSINDLLGAADELGTAESSEVIARYSRQQALLVLWRDTGELADQLQAANAARVFDARLRQNPVLRQQHTTLLARVQR